MSNLLTVKSASSAGVRDAARDANNGRPVYIRAVFLNRDGTRDFVFHREWPK